MQPNATMIKPEGLIRFMVYTDTDQREAIQLGGDVWMNLEAVLGDQYAYGSRFDVRPAGQEETVRYIVAQPPEIQQVEHPRKPSETVPLRVVYLVMEQP